MADAADMGGRRRLAPFIVVPVLVVVGLFVAVLATREPAVNRTTDSPLLGRQAPDFAGPTLAGGEFALTTERGRFVLVNFFATWCVPCQIEHPELRAFHERHAPIGDAEVVSIVFDDETADVRAYFEQNGGDWPVVVGDLDSIALDYGVTGIPESFLIGPDGTVVFKITGGVTDEGLEDLLRQAQGIP